MDDIKPPTRKSFDDVARPEDVPALPNSKPIITGNKPLQNDPMMAPTFTSTIDMPPIQKTDNVAQMSNDVDSPNIEAKPSQDTSVDTTTTEIADSSVSSADSYSQSTENVAVIENSDQPPHKMHHDTPFFGEMKPVKSRAKKIMIFLLILLLAGGITFAAWFFINNMQSQNSAPAITSTPQTPEKEKEQSNAIKVPDGYVTYSNADYNFSFAYPKEYGKYGTFSKSPANKTTDNSKVQLELKTSTPTSEYGPGITGEFSLTSYSSANQIILSRKYGPDIQLKDGKWIVVTTNPVDLSDNKVGQEYVDFEKKVIASQKNGDITVFTILSGDEGSTSIRLAFVSKDALHLVSLPSFSDGLYGGEKANDQTAFNTLVKNVRDSITSTKIQ